MKYINSLLLIFILLICSCSSSEEELYFDTNLKEITFNSNGGTEKIIITTNDDWNISCDFPWINVSQRSGSGDAQVSVIIQSNSEYDARMGYLTISPKKQPNSVKVEVNQKQKDVIETSSNNLLFDWNGGSSVITLKDNVESMITLSPSVDWVRVETVNSRTLNERQIKISVDENDSDERSCTLLIQGEDLTKEVLVKQKAFIALESFNMVEGNSLLISEDKDLQLHVIYVPNNSSDKTLEWSSSDKSVVEINQEGLIHVVNNGDCILYAYNKRANLKLEIPVKVRIKANKFMLLVPWEVPEPLMGYMYDIQGNWGYKFVPRVYVEPHNAYIDDMYYESENEDLVSIDGNRIICNNKNLSGQTRVTAYLPSSDLSFTFNIDVQCCYKVAGLGLITQTENQFWCAFAGSVYSMNELDKFKIEGVSIVDSQNRVITTTNNISKNETNQVKWVTPQINLSNYGINIIDEEFYSTLSKWKCIVTYRYNNSDYTVSESVNIDPHTQY